MEPITFRKIAAGGADYEMLLQFRNRLLRIPLGLNLFEEDLSEDRNALIIAAFLEDAIIGCVMLQPVDATTYKLRQMAVDTHLQGSGIGKRIVRYAEQAAKEAGITNIVLHARVTAREFYEQLGYTPFGNIFTEVTIPHIAMKKDLS